MYTDNASPIGSRGFALLDQYNVILNTIDDVSSCERRFCLDVVSTEIISRRNGIGSQCNRSLIIWLSLLNSIRRKLSVLFQKQEMHASSSTEIQVSSKLPTSKTLVRGNVYALKRFFPPVQSGWQQISQVKLVYNSKATYTSVQKCSYLREAVKLVSRSGIPIIEENK